MGRLFSSSILHFLLNSLHADKEYLFHMKYEMRDMLLKLAETRILAHPTLFIHRVGRSSSKLQCLTDALALLIRIIHIIHMWNHLH